MSIQVIPHLTIRGASEALDFYEKAFGATNIFKLPLDDGRLMHGSMEIGGQMIFVCDEFPEHGGKGPQTLGSTPVAIHLQVENCDEVFQKAVEAGCEIRMPMEDAFWGDRYGRLTDPYGHEWSVATQLREVSPDELEAKMKDFSNGGLEEACSNSK